MFFLQHPYNVVIRGIFLYPNFTVDDVDLEDTIMHPFQAPNPRGSIGSDGVQKGFSFNSLKTSTGIASELANKQLIL